MSTTHTNLNTQRSLAAHRPRDTHREKRRLYSYIMWAQQFLYSRLF
jgi:hypothetical protein